MFKTGNIVQVCSKFEELHMWFKIQNISGLKIRHFGNKGGRIWGWGYNFVTGIGIDVVIETVTVQLNCDTGQPSPSLHSFAFKHFRFVSALKLFALRSASG